MPANKKGKRITTGDYNRQDGFSPGQTIVVRLKGLTPGKAFTRSRLVPLSDLGRSFAKRAGVVVINARTRKRQLIYAELDANAKRASDKTLLIHPGKNFDEGARYIVALRGLRTSSGKQIKAQQGLRRAQAGQGPEAPAQALQGHLQDAQARRHREGEPDARLGLHRRQREGADRAHAAHPQRRVRPARRQNLADGKVEGSAPKFTVTKVLDIPRPADRCAGSPARSPCPATSTGGLPARRRVPLREPGAGRAPDPAPGNIRPRVRVRDPAGRRSTSPVARLALRPRPARHPDEIDAETSGTCRRSTTSRSARPRGAACRTRTSRTRSSCSATSPVRLAGRPRSAGLPQPAVPRPAARPPAGPDRRPGLPGPASVDPSQLYYDGNSQGGIFGGALTAIAPDFTRAVLGVPGINFGVLLHALVGLRHLRAIFNPAYPREPSDRSLLVADQDAVGPRRGRRLGAPRHHRPARRTRRATAC